MCGLLVLQDNWTKQQSSSLHRLEERSCWSWWSWFCSCADGEEPARSVGLTCPVCSANLSQCTVLHCLPVSFSCFSFVGPPNDLCIHSVLTPLFLSSFSQLSPSLYLDLCPGAHQRGICVECVLSLRNGCIQLSVWCLWKEISPEWHIVVDKRRLVLSVRGHGRFVKSTWACTVADCSLCNLLLLSV